jgi:hypothetical protein
VTLKPASRRLDHAALLALDQRAAWTFLRRQVVHAAVVAVDDDRSRRPARSTAAFVSPIISSTAAGYAVVRPVGL